MKILPVNNSNTNSNFRARLPKKDLDNLVAAALKYDSQGGIPKLYTLLKRLEKLPGEKAEIKEIKPLMNINSQSALIGFISQAPNICQLRIDGQLVKEGSDIYATLNDAVNSLEWQGNSDKTVKDIEHLFRE